MISVSISERDRQARNQVMFRLVNERVHSLAGDAHKRELRGYLCEGGTDHCLETIQLYSREYEAARSSPVRFLLAPGHETLGVDWPIETSERFVLIERLVGTEIATENDPRANGAKRTAT